MDLISIKNDLQSRFTVFENEDDVKRWIKNKGYTWITKNNKDEATREVQDYVKSEIENRVKQLQDDIEKTIASVLQDDIKISSFIEATADSWGVIIGGGGAALLTLLIEGAVFWPLAVVTAIVGFFVGREKMTNDFARSVFDSSKSIQQKACEKIEPIIDELISKLNEASLADNFNEQKEDTEEEYDFTPNVRLTKVYVKHAMYGVGAISNIQNNIISVQFNDVIKNFIFPDAFIKKNGPSFLDIVDTCENITNAIQYFDENNLLDKFLSTKSKDFLTKVNNSWVQECAERKRLLDYMDKKGFVGFLHTTNFSNFVSIYKGKKLLSRNKLKALGAFFDDCAEVDIIEGTDNDVKDSNRFYFRAKTPTNYSAFRYHNQKNPVIFVLKKECIFDRSVVFYDGNARASNSKWTKSALVAYSLFKWNCIFSDVIAYDNDETNEFLRIEGCSLGELKRMQNAEVLFKNDLDLDLFDKICFRTVQDYQIAVGLFGRDKRFVCDPKMFCL